MFKVPLKLALLSMLLLFLLPGTSIAAGPNWHQVVDEVGATLDQALKMYE